MGWEDVVRWREGIRPAVEIKPFVATRDYGGEGLSLSLSLALKSQSMPPLPDFGCRSVCCCLIPQGSRCELGPYPSPPLEIHMQIAMCTIHLLEKKVAVLLPGAIYGIVLGCIVTFLFSAAGDPAL